MTDTTQTIEELQSEIASLRIKLHKAERWQAKFAKAVGLPETATNEQIFSAFHLRRCERQMLGAAAERLLRSSTVPKTYDDGEPISQYERLNRLWKSEVKV
jgi:hypothetical protein